MTKSFWTTGRISGGLLMLSIAVIVAEFIAVLIQGNFEGVPAAWEGVEEIGEQGGSTGNLSAAGR